MPTRGDFWNDAKDCFHNNNNNGDIGNGLAGAGYVSGAAGNWAGNVIKSRSIENYEFWISSKCVG